MQPHFDTYHVTPVLQDHQNQGKDRLVLCPRCYKMDEDMLRVGAKLASMKAEVAGDRVLASGPHRQPSTGDLHLQATEQVRPASTHCRLNDKSFYCDDRQSSCCLAIKYTEVGHEQNTPTKMHPCRQAHSVIHLSAAALLVCCWARLLILQHDGANGASDILCSSLSSAKCIVKHLLTDTNAKLQVCKQP